MTTRMTAAEAAEARDGALVAVRREPGGPFECPSLGRSKSEQAAEWLRAMDDHSRDALLYGMGAYTVGFDPAGPGMSYGHQRYRDIFKTADELERERRAAQNPQGWRDWSRS